MTGLHPGNNRALTDRAPSATRRMALAAPCEREPLQSTFCSFLSVLHGLHAKARGTNVAGNA
jgi:hypothetical protein